ncbi:MAG: hypothetical protein ACRD0B_05230 [Acidimicrobiales bacterium]
MKPSWRAAAALCAALTVVAAGCGAGGAGDGAGTGNGATSATAQLAAALKRTSTSFRERVRIEEVGLGALGGGLPQTVVVAADGAFDSSSGRASFVMRLPATGALSGRGPLEMKIIVDSRSGSAYLELPSALRHGAAAKPWVEERAAALAGGESSAFGGGTFEPKAFLGQLGDLAKHVRRLGTATIDGAEMTKYSMTVTGPQLAKAMTSLQPKSGATASKLLSQIGRISYIFFVDSSGHLRRVSFDIGVGGLLSHLLGSIGASAGAGGQTPPSVLKGLEKVHVSCAMSLYDFGATIHVALPPPGEIQEAPASQSAGGIASSLPGLAL